MIDNMNKLDILDMEEFIEELFLLNHNLWKTSEGKVMKMKEMSISHLKNSIKYCKEHRFRLEFIPRLLAELKAKEKAELKAKEKSEDNIIPELLKKMHFLVHINSKEDLYTFKGRLIIHNLIYNSLRVLSTRH